MLISHTSEQFLQSEDVLINWQYMFCLDGRLRGFEDIRC